MIHPDARFRVLCVCGAVAHFHTSSGCEAWAVLHRAGGCQGCDHVVSIEPMPWHRRLGDVNAIQKGRVPRRIARRLVGKLTGRLLGRLFR